MDVKKEETIGDIVSELRKIANGETAYWVQMSTENIRNLARRIADAYVRDVHWICENESEAALRANEMCRQFAKKGDAKMCQYCRYVGSCYRHATEGCDIAMDCDEYEMDPFYTAEYSHEEH